MKWLVITLIVCTGHIPASAEVSSASPTQNFIAYLDSLLETQAIGDTELKSLGDVKDDALVCPISEMDAQRSSAKNIAYETIKTLLEDERTNPNEVLNWARHELAKREQDKRNRKRARDETESLTESSYTMLSAGLRHTCAIAQDRHVKCWGSDSFGQISKMPIDLGPVLSVSAGAYNTCAIKIDGNPLCWGDETLSQTNGWPNNWRQVLSISAGGFRTCAIELNGKVDCRGKNSPVDLGPVLFVSAGWAHVCAIKLDGNLACWGHDTDGQISGQPVDLGRVLAVSAGGNHTCAIKLDGELECWGREQAKLKPKDLGPVLAVSAGAHHTCAIKLDRNVECWGSDEYGQTRKNKPENLGSVLAVSAGNKHTCVVKPEGRVICWGDNSGAQSTPPEDLLVMTKGGGE